MIPHDRPGLASIIIPCWNQLEFTRQCVAALVRYTRPPWELIFIDNGSTDGTKDYCAGVRDAAAMPVTVITNATNRGFPAAINQGLKRAQGEYLVLLNNDVVVTDCWLEQLTALANAKAGSIGGRWDRRQHNGGALPSPPLTPPSQGGERICSQPDGAGAPSQSGEKIGLVGPMSNYAAPPQLVEAVPYRDLDELHGFARRWRDEHLGKWFNVPKLSGFCLLLKRVLYDAIGGLDERFGIGFFDDDDLAERTRRAGFELAVAHDLFVHHFGSRTFVGNGIDTGKLLRENARRFAGKWGLPEPRGRWLALHPWKPSSESDAEPAPDLESRPENGARTDAKLPGDPGWSETASDSQPAMRLERPGSGPADWASVLSPSGAPIVLYQTSSSPRNGTAQRDPGARPNASLTMIVKNEQDNLPHVLDSVRGLFDEIVVVDTGSADRTRRIAREFGAKVFDFAWIDDFAAARNEALARAAGDYAFWLDADDVIDPPEREKLRALLERLEAGDEAAYVVRCKCDPGADGTGGETVVDHIRLFPRRENVRWTYRVHEQILPALRRAKIPVRWTDITVRHTGYVDRELRARKLDRNAKILGQELKDHPNEPFILFNLGSIAIERKDWHEALGFLERSLARSAPSDSITRKLFALIARGHQMLGDSQAALGACAQGLKLDSEDAELWFRKAVVHRHRGESSEAEGCWRRILSLHRPEQFSSVDQGIYGHLTRRNLAVLAAERGDHAEAERLWRAVLAECPGDREATAILKRQPSAPGG